MQHGQYPDVGGGGLECRSCPGNIGVFAASGVIQPSILLYQKTIHAYLRSVWSKSAGFTGYPDEASPLLAQAVQVYDVLGP